MKKILRYLDRMWIAVNQLVNTIAGGAPDETVSARSGRTKKGPVCDAFRLLGSPEHCESAIEAERRERKNDPAYRPAAFITRRGALLTVPVLALFGNYTEANEREIVITLDKPIRVQSNGREVVIYPDAMLAALEAAVRMPR
jgi:hypothetical protein